MLKIGFLSSQKLPLSTSLIGYLQPAVNWVLTLTFSLHNIVTTNYATVSKFSSHNYDFTFHPHSSLRPNHIIYYKMNTPEEFTEKGQI